MGSGALRLERVYETVLYVRDLDAAASFYTGILGLRAVDEMDALGGAFRLPDGGVLLLFDPEQASQTNRTVPSHGAAGPGHVAFSVGSGELDRWEGVLRAHGVEIEQRVDWGGHARSIYVRDPAGNSVELAEGELWPD